MLALAQTRTTELSSWDFRKAADTEWAKVNLPHSCNNIDGQSKKYYRGDTYYRNILNVEKKAGGHYMLLFKSAAQKVTVNVNGKKAMLHKGGYTPFTVDITNFVKDGENEVIVLCNNEMDETVAPVSSDFNKNNGLHDKVYLLETGSVYADTKTMGYKGFHVSQLQIDRENAILKVETDLVNSLDVAKKVKVRVCVTDKNGNAVSDNSESVTLKQERTTSYVMQFNVEKPHLWKGLEDPYLYNVNLQVSAEEGLIENREARVGIRYYEMNPSRGFLLNGKEYPLRGFSYHQDKFNHASAVTEADIDRDFEIIKDLGLNMLRLAHYPHNEYTFDKCDELGIVVQTEIPWVNECHAGSETFSQDEYEEALVGQFKEMIRGHYNHPSVIFWGMWNELGNSRQPLDKEFMLKVTTRLYNLGHKELDPYRLYGFADCGPGLNAGNLKHKSCFDYFSTNKYFGWYQEQEDPENAKNFGSYLDMLREKNKIVSITEYGAGISPYCHSNNPIATTNPSAGGARHDEEWGNIIHERSVKEIMARPWLQYTTGWVLFDFAVADRLEGYIVSTDGTTTKEDEMKKYTNDKGIVTRDRQLKKDVFYLYRAWWNPETTVYITSRRFVTRHDKEITIKVYSNAKELSLYQNGEKVQTLSSSGEDTGIVWTFAPIEFMTSADTFRVVGVASDGKKYADEVVFEYK